MALSLFGERSLSAAAPVNPLYALAMWIGRVRTARARRVALERLLELDHCRLSDLGISRADIMDALAARSGLTPGMVLNAARARASRP